MKHGTLEANIRVKQSNIEMLPMGARSEQDKALEASAATPSQICCPHVNKPIGHDDNDD